MELIDRQAAIDALKNDMASLDHIIKDMSANDVRLDAYVSQRNQVNYDIYTINNLPPAQPAPCDDAVSREEVLNCLEWQYPDKLPRTKIMELPPVTPKQRTGKWIPVGVVDVVGGESAMWGSAIAYHKCSECDEQALKDDFDEEVLSKWCPHCGAKMEGDAE